jgi:predicted ATP-grasp superfamily ATP-dependent carboligase
VDVASFVPAISPGSNAIRDFTWIARPELRRDEFLLQIRNLVRCGGHDLIIPADDQALVAIVDNYKEFHNLAEVACPPPEIARTVLDKSLTLEVAQQCGIRVPQTKLISHSEQLRELSSSFRFPWILKPARKELTIEEIKSSLFKNAVEVFSRFPQRREFNPPMLLQEYCEGAGVGVELLMHDGECLAAFQHRRLEEVPHTGGVSATAIAEALDPVLFENSRKLLHALRWEGPAMVEFKVDSRDDKAVLMEVNGRYWGTISLPITAGIDFPYYHWQLLHGETPSLPTQYAVGTRWRWTAGHVWRLHGLMVSARRSGMARNELLRCVSHYVGSAGVGGRDPLLSQDDPMPAIFDLAQMVKYLSAYDVKAFLRHVSFR